MAASWGESLVIGASVASKPGRVSAAPPSEAPSSSEDAAAGLARHLLRTRGALDGAADESGERAGGGPTKREDDGGAERAYGHGLRLGIDVGPYITRGSIVAVVHQVDEVIVTDRVSGLRP